MMHIFATTKELLYLQQTCWSADAAASINRRKSNRQTTKPHDRNPHKKRCRHASRLIDKLQEPAIETRMKAKRIRLSIDREKNTTIGVSTPNQAD
jgi:nucleosome binding factor SPN SPT16 subunit